MAGSWDSADTALSRIKTELPPSHQNYLGFYSSWLGGFFREPWLMVLPLDDHGFHRGDGVFEAVRLVEGAYFDLNAHLDRLEKSAAQIQLQIPLDRPTLVDTLQKLARLSLSAAEAPNQAILRLFVTRGSGSFSPTPQDCKKPAVFAAVTRLKLPDENKYTLGARAIRASVLPKDAFWARIKSCNYLPNVMMRFECVERGVDFSLSVNEQGQVCEGATENFLLVSGDGDLKVPSFAYTLAGTTVQVVLELAQKLVKQGRLRSAGLTDIHIDDVALARELAFVGTTLGVLPVTQFDGKAVGRGAPGEVSIELHRLLTEEMRFSKTRRVPF